MTHSHSHTVLLLEGGGGGGGGGRHCFEWSDCIHFLDKLFDSYMYLLLNLSL